MKKADKNRKGWIAPVAIMIMTAIVLGGALLNAYDTSRDLRERRLGRNQFYIINNVQQAYRAQTYTDLAAKHSLRKAIINTAKNGGYAKEEYSECGTYGLFQLWQDNEKSCYPDAKKGIKENFERNLDEYILNYPSGSIKEFPADGQLIKGVFRTSIDDRGGIEITAKASVPWRFGNLYYTKDLEAFPVEGAEEDSFSNDWHMPREGGKRYHQGTDIMAKKGTPVVAAKSGKIVRIGCNGYGGNRIGIVDKDGNYFYYAHLDSYQPGLGVGDTVQAGQQIGAVGDTLGCKPGCTGPRSECGIKEKTEPHLHFGIYVRPTDKEDTVKQQNAYNPYYALKAFLEGKKVADLMKHISFEYRYYPAIRVKENYRPSDYDNIIDAMKKMEQECWARPECYAEEIKKEETPIKEELQQEENWKDTAPAVPDKTRQEVNLDGAGVSAKEDENSKITKESDTRDGFDWIIEYDGKIITKDENGEPEEDKWKRYCESAEEYVYGKIDELFYECRKTKDSECKCSIDLNKIKKDDEKRYRKIGWEAYFNLNRNYKLHNQDYVIYKGVNAKDFDLIIAGPRSKYGEADLIWFPYFLRIINTEFNMDFKDEKGESRPEISPLKSKEMILYKTKNKEGNPSFKFIYGDGEEYVSADNTLKIKKGNARECIKPKVIKVCVINTKAEILQETEDEKGKSTVDYGPVVYRFAYHLRSGIPRVIKNNEIEIQDKFREKGAVVVKWPDIDTDDNTKYIIYYSKDAMTTFTKKKLDEMAEKTEKGEEISRHAPVYKIELEAKNAENHKGSININYIFYDALKGNKWYVVTRKEENKDGSANNKYELTELKKGTLYHFSNPHYVYVVDKLEDGAPYYFTVVGVNEDDEATDEPLESRSGVSIDDAPPELFKKAECTYKASDKKLVCTFDSIPDEIDEIIIINRYKDKNDKTEIEEKRIRVTEVKDNRVELPLEQVGEIIIGGSRKVTRPSGETPTEEAEAPELREVSEYENLESTEWIRIIVPKTQNADSFKKEPVAVRTE